MVLSEIVWYDHNVPVEASCLFMHMCIDKNFKFENGIALRNHEVCLHNAWGGENMNTRVQHCKLLNSAIWINRKCRSIQTLFSFFYVILGLLLNSSIEGIRNVMYKCTLRVTWHVSDIKCVCTKTNLETMQLQFCAVLHRMRIFVKRTKPVCKKKLRRLVSL